MNWTDFLLGIFLGGIITFIICCVLFIKFWEDNAEVYNAERDCSNTSSFTGGKNDKHEEI